MARRLVVEADGASRGNPGEASYGALVRDAETGELLAEHAEYLGVTTNNVAEYNGLLAGLRAARRIDPEAAVEVRMDSKLVVEQMSGRWQVKHPDLRPLAAAARAAFPASDRLGFTWVPRAENKHADRLANEALDARAAGHAWRDGAPPPASAAPAAETSIAAGGAPAARPATGWGPDRGTPTTLLLARHGMTALSPAKRFSGIGDPDLSAAGRAQAAALAVRVAAISTATEGGVTAVVSSPAARARQTAGAAADALGVAAVVEDELHETDFGAWEGLTFAEARASSPEAFERWLADSAAAPPGGESFDAVTERVLRARDRVLAGHPRATVLVVSHVTPIKTLVRAALGAPASALYRMELDTASLSSIAYFADGAASLRRFNDTAHLDPRG